MSEWMGESVIEIGSTVLTARVSSQRGGRIVSLVDDAGREWLSQPAALSALPEAGDVFTEGDLSGWDECAPTIDADRWEGITLPDHGDLWTARWEVDGASMTAAGASLGYRLTRSITPTGRGLRLEYTVRSEREIPFLWAPHPLFAAPPGARVELPAGVHVIDPVTGAEQAADALTIDSYPPGTCAKLFVHPDDFLLRASLVHADGSRITLTWSDDAPYLGLWFDNAALGSQPVIAIEPMTGYFDSVSRALDNDRVATVRPHRPLTVRLEVVVG